MFFHRDLIKCIGLPDERYYLYSDDHDFSYRISRRGGEIFLLTESVVYDVSTSWGLRSGSKIKEEMTTDAHFRLYYNTRNRVYFERKYLLNNEFVYLINVVIYTMVCLSVSLLNFRFENFLIYLKALSHGWIGKLGINDDYIL
jgi:GT2 family glycosyltransferase